MRRLRLDKSGFIFQYPNLLPFLKAIENVAEVLDLAGFRSAAGHSRAVHLLDYLEVGHRKSAMPVRLSGGEAQRVALANRPRIILADKPTAPLDLQRARVVMDLLHKIAVDQSAAIICVTHDEMILGRFDHIFRLHDGRLEGKCCRCQPGDCYGQSDTGAYLIGYSIETTAAIKSFAAVTRELWPFPELSSINITSPGSRVHFSPSLARISRCPCRQKKN